MENKNNSSFDHLSLHGCTVKNPLFDPMRAKTQSASSLAAPVFASHELPPALPDEGLIYPVATLTDNWLVMREPSIGMWYTEFEFRQDYRDGGINNGYCDGRIGEYIGDGYFMDDDDTEPFRMSGDFILETH